MPTKSRATRDRDLDERPFGDSHFEGLRRDPQGHAKSRSRPTHAERVDEGEPSSRYAWHEGFFDDLEPRPAHRKNGAWRTPSHGARK